MRFSEQLFRKVQPIWEENHQHPFVTGIGDGTLDLETFKFYIVQDYLYLLDYAKIYALGVVKATDLRIMARFAKQIDGILNGEMALHRHYAARLGIAEQEIASAKPSAMNLAYTNYMLATAQNGTLAELIAALLPCMWSYWEIGKRLNEAPGAAEHLFYGEWVRGYSSAEYGALCTWLIDVFDELAEGKPVHELARLEEIFINTSRFEYLFWDMAYHQEMWGGHGQSLTVS